MTSVYTHDAAKEYLAQGRDKLSRPIENNTRVESRGDDIAIRLHGTDVVTFHPDGSVTLNTGGWLTVTTKDRINKFLAFRGAVYSDKGVWYYYPRSGGWGAVEREKRERYFDGIRISSDGSVLNPQPVEVQARLTKAEDAMKRRIRLFVDGYMRALEKGMPVPSGGDCWDCAFVTNDGKTMGDLKEDQVHGHLFSHMTERYYVPTLLVNAVKERGYGDYRFVLSMRLDNEALGNDTMRLRRAWGSDQPDVSARKDLRRDLTKYLNKRLLKGRAH